MVVAHGAGGLTGGANASDAVVDAVRAHAGDPTDLRAWASVLRSVDAELAAAGAGETTALVLVLGAFGVAGVSAGDSEAWRVGGTIERLTEGQSRVRLGTHRCRPWSFHARASPGVLVAATDGLFRHASTEAIRDATALGSADAIADALVALPRGAGGRYADDVGLVVVTS